MVKRGELVSFNTYGWHKGFYNDEKYSDSLLKIYYSDFFEEPDDDEFPYVSANELLNGLCNHFAISLNKIYKYNVYVIQQNDKRGFHAFCQIYKNRQWYYADARGITSSFDEFLSGVRTFVGDEFTIRPMSVDDVEEWEKDCKYNDEAYAFSEAVIKKYSECYTL
ncbi:hypothetical protein CIRMBP1284_00967 [Enterococcus cecorum]|uniref:hypothetical protein n=1 Tax=Enterococcus cecorum TaxID=44008 RepID=UPI0022D6910A|nr:hypothetical protein [Enterococcus cecorum]CAI3292648.1 hypothetical protein CIRMBP1250_00583 [Enterococcus cecorum]CAI3302558.1 hypothetical protein CIRMBP1256_00707 [Enterococcus cecorum]CAI3308809.1 hypothetical protein CIRMBP1266_00697 [Enterococcus cecorum]CAI3314927.1 hypothetical protein CIRMBP1244_00819 [Enterococcus cecorum]CAI3326021.1 hypothetical protein CIRMBP1237_00772 [Enterococcus cecorum]